MVRERRCKCIDTRRSQCRLGLFVPVQNHDFRPFGALALSLPISRLERTCQHINIGQVF